MAGDGSEGSGYGLGLSTRTQVTGYQFLARRTAMALTRWRVRMEIEPGRRQTLAVVASVSAALVICLGALLCSFISPSGQLNESPIIADRDSGALYVRVGDKLYPALNLASARLIAGRADNPHKVRGVRSPSSRTDRWWVSPAHRRSFPRPPRRVVVAGVRLGDAERGGSAVTGDSHRDRRHARPSSRRHVLNGSDAVVLHYGMTPT